MQLGTRKKHVETMAEVPAVGLYTHRYFFKKRSVDTCIYVAFRCICIFFLSIYLFIYLDLYIYMYDLNYDLLPNYKPRSTFDGLR